VAILEEGEPVRLTPAVDPPLGALAWWAFVPVLLAASRRRNHGVRDDVPVIFASDALRICGRRRRR